MHCNKHGRSTGMRIVFYGSMWCTAVITKSEILTANNVLNNSASIYYIYRLLKKKPINSDIPT